MRRPALITLAALGALVCALGGTGLFAALTDTARSGTSSAESAPLAASADIQIAQADVTVVNGESTFSCGTFTEDLTTAFFTLQDVRAGFDTGPPATVNHDHGYCLRNVGSQAVELSVLIDELADVDFACTGDEALHGDATCGDDGSGELSSVLVVAFTGPDAGCGPTDAFGWIDARTLAGGTTNAVPLGALAVGETRCFELRVQYPQGTPISEQQAVQSDRVTWRYRWTAQA